MPMLDTIDQSHFHFLLLDQIRATINLFKKSEAFRNAATVSSYLLHRLVNVLPKNLPPQNEGKCLIALKELQTNWQQLQPGHNCCDLYAY